MTPNKSLDEVLNLIVALLRDAHASRELIFNISDLNLALKYVRERSGTEGIGFLTKTLPRLGKHFDQVLAGMIELDVQPLGFETQVESKLPSFLGSMFSAVLAKDGSILTDPDAKCVKLIRQVLYSFYKYELPYDESQEQQVIEAFKQAEKDLSDMSPRFAFWHTSWHSINKRRFLDKIRGGDESLPIDNLDRQYCIIRDARRLLAELFQRFDPTDITPSHGPGVVATKQRLWSKFDWTNVSDRITTLYPFDAYFCASPGHVCDVFKSFDALTATDLPARVILVPKDSRGPRLISCEPVDFQWVQQGLRRAIYRLVESHPLSKWNVFFTDQLPNQLGALLGSSNGKYSTLDLQEASDRVHIDLVRLIFPARIIPYLEACRSDSTVLPSGEKLKLNKYAPMGSALCFPVMALTIWALLAAASPDVDTREGTVVYGDDVIVPTAFAGSAMAVLEEFGLKINRSKSCLRGLFRESCGVDAFNGVNVTPVRFRTVWMTSPRPDVYTSWIAYANLLWRKQYYFGYDYIVSRLRSVYGPIPGTDMHLACPSLEGISADSPSSFKRRLNKSLQKLEYKVRVVKSPAVIKVINGWSMLLRYFSEAQKPALTYSKTTGGSVPLSEESVPFSVSRYTRRDTSILVWRWR